MHNIVLCRFDAMLMPADAEPIGRLYFGAFARHFSEFCVQALMTRISTSEAQKIIKATL